MNRIWPATIPAYAGQLPMAYDAERYDLHLRYQWARTTTSSWRTTFSPS
jgi:hypothetical protein